MCNGFGVVQQRNALLGTENRSTRRTSISMGTGPVFIFFVSGSSASSSSSFRFPGWSSPSGSSFASPSGLVPGSSGLGSAWLASSTGSATGSSAGAASSSADSSFVSTSTSSGWTVKSVSGTGCSPGTSGASSANVSDIFHTGANLCGQDWDALHFLRGYVSYASNCLA